MGHQLRQQTGERHLSFGETQVYVKCHISTHNGLAEEVVFNAQLRTVSSTQHSVCQGILSLGGPYAATGGSSSISANRISYSLGLKGPSVSWQIHR